jgi:mannose-1-phosphate guanylyltransferase
MKNQYCVIMAGGVGTRFWPMSRTNYPKQFLDILGIGKTLLQQTYHRHLSLCPVENIFVVTNEIYKDIVREQLPDLPLENILLEPLRKNTAPCIAYASYKIHQLNPHAVAVVVPSDHLITKEQTYTKAIRACFAKAKNEDCLVTLGITPTRPDTGYGYIQFEDSPKKENDKRIKKVKTFAEKPDLEQAKLLLESGDFLWNAGIFIWTTSSIIRAFEKYEPDMAALFAEGNAVYNTPSEIDFIQRTYSSCRSESVDYAIMEKAENVYVRASIIGWSDLGTWGSIYSHVPHTEGNNAVVGKNVLLYDSKNCVVHVPKDKLVVIQGLEDYIVVEADGILLVCKKQDEQLIRNLVNDVKVIKGDKYV